MRRAKDLKEMVLNFILGTAAELIKVHPVIRLAEAQGHSVRLIATGQSRENLIMQLRDFGYDPAKVQWLVGSDGDLAKSSSALKWFFRALISFTSARRLLSEGHVIVHGDTISTLVGAFHGWRLSRPVVHVEAGLRSPHLLHPFPEEINRRLVSRFARLHMAPDETAAANLKRARAKGTILNTGGNTLMDAVRLSGEDQAAPAGFALVNVHRYENLNSPERWARIVDCVLQAARTRKVVFVAHPQTVYKLKQDQAAAERFRGAGVEVRERMPFSQFIALLKAADYLISDGGSNQEECSYLGKPCLLLRESTERVEGLGGCCVLSRFEQAAIERFLANPNAYRANPVFGARSPSEVIMENLADN